MYNACRVIDDVYIAPLTVAHDYINHQVASVIQIHVVEYRRNNQKWTIQRLTTIGHKSQDKYTLENTKGVIKKGQYNPEKYGNRRRRKTKQKHNTICVGH